MRTHIGRLTEHAAGESAHSLSPPIEGAGRAALGVLEGEDVRREVGRDAEHGEAVGEARLALEVGSDVVVHVGVARVVHGERAVHRVAVVVGNDVVHRRQPAQLHVLRAELVLVQFFQLHDHDTVPMRSMVVTPCHQGSVRRAGCGVGACGPERRGKSQKSPSKRQRHGSQHGVRHLPQPVTWLEAGGKERTGRVMPKQCCAPGPKMTS